MARVNLLPWREERRKQREQQFYQILLAGAMLAGLAVAGAWYAVDMRIGWQNSRNQMLTKEIKALDSKLTEIKDIEKTRQELLARMNVIEKLQADRNATVLFFNALADVTPEGVHISSIEQNSSSVKVQGIAESNSRVSDFMNQINASTLFNRAELQIIRTTQKEFQRRSHFTLNFVITDNTPEAEVKNK